MAQQETLKIPRLSDSAITNFYSELGEKYHVTKVSVSAFCSTYLGEVDFSNEENIEWVALLKHNSYLISSMSFAIRGLSITYYRGGSLQQKSPIYDEINLSWNENIPDRLNNQEKLEVIAFLNSKLRPFEPERIAGRSVSEEDSQLIAIHQSTLERLEQLNEHLIEKSAEFRENLEKKFDENISKNEEKYLKKIEVLESDYSSRFDEVKNRENAVEEKLKSIDDRNNTHARREIRDKMLNDVKDRINQFGVSRTTEEKRKPVLYGILLLGMTLILLISFTIFEINNLKENSKELMSSIGENFAQINKIEPNNTIKNFAKKENVETISIYWLWIRLAVLCFGLIGIILYYIKWQNKWAEQHINSEFQLQQFYIDVNRSNWVIESCLEWKKVTESAIPIELLNSITKNLFINKETDLERVIHPADELASALLGSASKLKLKIGDSELDFDNLKKIAKKPLVSNAKTDE